MARRKLWLVCLVGGLAAAHALQGWASEAGPLSGTRTTIEGHLLSSGASVALASGKRQIRLGSASSYLMHTLMDPRLRNRQVRLAGNSDRDGTFEVEHLWTLKDGKLYKVRYYCHVCNIAATEPGPCVCCQRPTELEEIPVAEVAPDMLVVP